MVHQAHNTGYFTHPDRQRQQKFVEQSQSIVCYGITKIVNVQTSHFRDIA